MLYGTVLVSLSAIQSHMFIVCGDWLIVERLGRGNCVQATIFIGEEWCYSCNSNYNLEFCDLQSAIENRYS